MQNGIAGANGAANITKIYYEIFDHGWAACNIDIAGYTHKVTASYLTDALADLLDATNLIVAGEAAVRFSFEEEPGEYRWIFRQTAEKCLTVKILWFPDQWEKKADSEGKTIFVATCSSESFCWAVAEAASNLLDEHGLREYRRIWGSAFPEEEYIKLCNSLSHPLSSRIIRKGHERSDNQGRYSRLPHNRRHY